MHPLLELAEIVTRAVAALALSIAPPLGSPEPVAASPVIAIAAAASLGALLYASERLRGRAASREARAGAAAMWIAVAAAIASAAWFRGDRAPIARAMPFVAPPAWAAIALAAVMVADRLAPAFRFRKLAAAGAVITLGAALFAVSARWLGSREAMWWEALRRDAGNGRALDALTRGSLGAKRIGAAREAVDACLTERPTHCGCLRARVDLTLRVRSFASGLALARDAAERCPDDADVGAAFAEAVGLAGDPAEAVREARAQLARGGPEARLRYALALGLNGTGKQGESIVEARRAVALGAGRNARMLLAVLTISAGDLDDAARALGPIVAADPGDAEAGFNLALVADRRGDYNAARSGYLAALRADPRLANARLNLAHLTFRWKVLSEAKHHARRFIEAFPGDPRGPEIARIVGLDTGSPR